jgi:hypothetical protein
MFPAFPWKRARKKHCKTKQIWVVYTISGLGEMMKAGRPILIDAALWCGRRLQAKTE